MTTTSDHSSRPAEPVDGPAVVPSRRRRLVLAVVAAVVAVALVVLVVVLSGRDDAAGDGAASSTPSATTSSGASSPSASAPTTPGAEPSAPAGSAQAVPVDGNEPPPQRPPVALDAGDDVDGVTGSLALVEEIDGSAQGPGNINGPALRITVRLVNGTDADLALSGVAVSVFHGADRTPASPLEDRSQSPFAGDLPPGDAAEGVYVLRVPADDRDDIRVEVGVRPGAAVMVFTGAV
ncbi:hypothetical protein [Blastococcus haudaquaticus]|uniref:DUF4352 domain-containing protein n=1 Tax=Blastococcus haudaquaticus TaxID=1938745 RepID=A0A286GZV2_9ACTN|nr:hypothetical protein [Blastococcus haudaquaticus]SOE01053.1 hypothetical protein SAMN06272739_2935 [Blastococcus haudaquaticus]